MRLTIIPSDGVVGIDGVFRPVDKDEMDHAIHAVQFDDATGVGEIEFVAPGVSNERIVAREQFNKFIDLWTAAAPVVPPVVRSTDLGNFTPSIEGNQATKPFAVDV